MAKRKRLSPTPLAYSPDQSVPETKLMMRVPIADVAADSSASAAFAEVTEAMQAARDDGRMVLEIALTDIQMDFLVRDRMASDDAEMTALKTSIAERGQQTAIEVIALSEGGYGLISGWRRCQALKALFEETGEDRFLRVLALNRRPVDQAESYIAMVEENEIRVGLSYYERARIAAKATEQGAYADEKQALQSLFRSASRAKRSKIGSFLNVYHALDEALNFPETIGERLGLKLARQIEASRDGGRALRTRIANAGARTAEGEQAAVEAALKAVQRSARKLAPKISPRLQTRHLKSGIVAQFHSDGRLELSGKGMTQELGEQLLEWLDR